MTPLEKLLSRAIRLDSGCLVLPNHLDNPKVYPYVYLGPKRTVRANRLVWESVHGPTDLLICHTCDYPRCFAIEHLFAGGQRANMQDMTEKGRHAYRRGEEHYNWRGGFDRKEWGREWRAALTEEKREQMRAQVREANRRRRAAYTPEQREEERRQNRERNRRAAARKKEDA